MDSVPEEWRAIPGHQGYEVSDLGRVRSVDRVVVTVRNKKPYPSRQKGRVLKPFCRRGYHSVTIQGGLGDCDVHRLVALAFIGPWSTGEAIDHVNGIKKDNRSLNLEYVTNAENTRRACALGLMNSKQPVPVLKTEDVIEIRRLYNTIPLAELAVQFKVTPRHASDVARGRKWKHIPMNESQPAGS